MATLEELRIEAGLSQAALARAANVDYNTYRRAENGEAVQDVKAAAIARALSEKLGRRIDYRSIDGLAVL